jgi:hypothetical protein
MPLSVQRGVAPAPVGAPSDGQVAAYNATTGLWEFTTPAGGQEVAYSENVSGTAYTLTTTPTAITGLGTLTVPATSRTLWLEGEAIVDVTTTPGAGTVGVVQLDITDDLGAAIGSSMETFEPGHASAYQTVRVKVRVGTLAAQRVYTLKVSKSGNGSATFAGALMNGALSTAFRTFFAASLR